MDPAVNELRDAILICTGIVIVYLLAMARQLALLKRPGRRMMDAKEPTLANAESTIDASLNPTETLRANRLAMHSFSIELKRMSIEIDQLRTALNSKLHADQSASWEVAINSLPLYNNAIACARRGISAAGIASRCRMSLGEAELVIALALNSGKNAMEEATHSSHPYLAQGNDRQHRTAA